MYISTLSTKYINNHVINQTVIFVYNFFFYSKIYFKNVQIIECTCAKFWPTYTPM